MAHSTIFFAIPTSPINLMRSRGAWHLDFTPLQYRWGALTLRKKSKAARVRSEFFTTLSLDEFESSRATQIMERMRKIPEFARTVFDYGGLAAETLTYVGSALNLRKRLSTQFAAGQLDDWEKDRGREVDLVPWETRSN